MEAPVDVFGLVCWVDAHDDGVRVDLRADWLNQKRFHVPMDIKGVQYHVWIPSRPRAETKLEQEVSS